MQLHSQNSPPSCWPTGLAILTPSTQNCQWMEVITLSGSLPVCTVQLMNDDIFKDSEMSMVEVITLSSTLPVCTVRLTNDGISKTTRVGSSDMIQCKWDSGYLCCKKRNTHTSTQLSIKKFTTFTSELINAMFIKCLCSVTIPSTYLELQGTKPTSNSWCLCSK